MQLVMSGKSGCTTLPCQNDSTCEHGKLLLIGTYSKVPLRICSGLHGIGIRLSSAVGIKLRWVRQNWKAKRHDCKVFQVISNLCLPVTTDFCFWWCLQWLYLHWKYVIDSLINATGNYNPKFRLMMHSPRFRTQPWELWKEKAFVSSCMSFLCLSTYTEVYCTVILWLFLFFPSHITFPSVMCFLNLSLTYFCFWIQTSIQI